MDEKIIKIERRKVHCLVCHIHRNTCTHSIGGGYVIKRKKCCYKITTLKMIIKENEEKIKWGKYAFKENTKKLHTALRRYKQGKREPWWMTWLPGLNYV